MGFEDLTENDRKVYEYIKARDFVAQKWDTRKAALELGLTEDEVYESLSNLTRLIRDNIWIFYRDGGIRIVVE